MACMPRQALSKSSPISVNSPLLPKVRATRRLSGKTRTASLQRPTIVSLLSETCAENSVSYVFVPALLLEGLHSDAVLGKPLQLLQLVALRLGSTMKMCQHLDNSIPGEVLLWFLLCELRVDCRSELLSKHITRAEPQEASSSCEKRKAILALHNQFSRVCFPWGVNFSGPMAATAALNLLVLVLEDICPRMASATAATIRASVGLAEHWTQVPRVLEQLFFGLVQLQLHEVLLLLLGRWSFQPFP